jgi:hypothetical protein
MRSQNSWTGILVIIFMGVLLSAAVVLAGSLEPSVGSTAAGSQTHAFLPLVKSAGGGTCSAGVARTGQTTPYGTRDDGALQEGVAWPNPRFTNNANGTVTDNLTGLIWLKNANCFLKKPWTEALSDANGLASGSCGLSDGSTAGQWRLPNVKELQSLIDFAHYSPTLSNAAGTGQWSPGNPFDNVQSEFYWSGTSTAGGSVTFITLNAWAVSLNTGITTSGFKTYTSYIWPVRSGQ